MNDVDVLELVLEVATDGVRAVGEQMTDPNDDWQPMLIFAEADGSTHIAAIDPQFMGHENTKDVLAYVMMPQLLTTVDAVACAFVSSTWVVEAPNNPASRAMAEAGVRPSEHPDRQEAVNVTGMTKKRFRLLQAYIVRTDDKPPMLCEFERFGTDEDAQFTGRFVDPLREALKEGA